MHDHEHTRPTEKNRNRYWFTAKHHALRDVSEHSQWSRDLSEDDEFSVFELADNNELADDSGDLYGVLLSGMHTLRTLGRIGEQIGFFWEPSPGSSCWHGFPVYPLNENGLPEQQQKKRIWPPKSVIAKMNECGVITTSMRKRLNSKRFV
jgi:hypothetical protein